MKIPWSANSVLVVVETTPSGPPSYTSIFPTSQTARFPSETIPGMMASAVVVTEHVDPTVVLPVAAHGTVTLKVVSPVEGSFSEGWVCRSVTRSATFACSWPV